MSTKRLFLGVGTVASAAILLVSSVAVLTPRVVRAVTAQLVQNVDSPPRNAWVGSGVFLPTSELASENTCQISVPPGQAVTVQTLTFTGTAVNHKHILLTVTATIGSQVEIWNNQITSVVGDGIVPAHVDQFASSENLTLYSFNSSYSTTITAFIETDGNNDSSTNYSLSGGLTLIGYSVNVGTPSTN